MKYSAYDPLAWIDQELDALDERSLRRRLESHDGPQQVLLELGGRTLVNFGSNDYLGLASDSRLAVAAAQAGAAEGWGAGASPLITGYTTTHRQLEQRLADFEGTDAALLFTSGYAANLGTIAALASPGDAIYSDAKNHASIIDGCRLSRAKVHVYPHRDCLALENLLEQGAQYRRRLIVTESVFSMDGDLAPLAEIAQLSERYRAILLVDEAHATGVFGEHGRGLTEALGVEQHAHVRVGTLSKALGVAGGFACGTRSLVDWLANRARSYVFSTAPPAPLSAAGLAALDIVRDEPQRRRKLLATAAALRDRLRALGWSTGGSASQVIPIVLGKPGRAVRLATRLRGEQDLLVPAIRPPSVPDGESLLRISLSAAHTDDMIERLIAGLAMLGRPE